MVEFKLLLTGCPLHNPTQKRRNLTVHCSCPHVMCLTILKNSLNKAGTKQISAGGGGGGPGGRGHYIQFSECSDLNLDHQERPSPTLILTSVCLFIVCVCVHAHRRYAHTMTHMGGGQSTISGAASSFPGWWDRCFPASAVCSFSISGFPCHSRGAGVTNACLLGL